ncbi:MAG TPA: LysR family transcriptional regulator [Aquifex aeolicus]|uniref:LysR family transcriptional regulator n=1 Tax=Aquifex aeolicus TaxID=63363 RepID=A0A7C5L905_AQUAO|nr:LysR family transcriptional regulator [Aquifex aeolicus]
MRIRFRVWLEKEGEPIISEGKYRLLREIERTGSIKEAARRLGLSYKKAHSQIRTIEERLGLEVVERRRRRGAVLTDAGREILSEYERVLSAFRRTLRDLGGEL